MAVTCLLFGAGGDRTRLTDRLAYFPQFVVFLEKEGGVLRCTPLIPEQAPEIGFIREAKETKHDKIYYRTFAAGLSAGPGQ